LAVFLVRVQTCAQKFNFKTVKHRLLHKLATAFYWLF